MRQLHGILFKRSRINALEAVQDALRDLSAPITRGPPVSPPCSRRLAWKPLTSVVTLAL